ncbi:ER membrane protein complex subunit 10 [Aphelenchoides bicaudatus]|nr:ER membrane protein complex subunit 10 [Aphelenchoides bicaudatus]
MGKYSIALKCLLLCAVFLGCHATKKWDLPLEYSVNSGTYQPLGKIELFLQDDGNYTGRFEANSGVNVNKIYSSLAQQKSNVLYSVRSGDVFSSNEACLMLLADLNHEFALTIDSVRQKLLSLTVYPAGVYDVGNEVCSQDGLKDKKPSKINGNVVVTNVRELPSPDIATYLQRIEEEKRARQHGASQDNRSFFAKYWMYIVPAVIFLLVTNAISADQQQE